MKFTKTVQSLKGNVKEYMSNLNNLAKSSAEVDKKPAIIKKPTYMPVKEKIHFLDYKDKTPDNEEFLMKHKSIAKKLIDEDDGPIIEKSENGNDHEENGKMNGNHKEIDTPNPPKPLPRKSLSDQGSFELDNNIFPKPKPRTAATGYKVQNYEIFVTFIFRFELILLTLLIFMAFFVFYVLVCLFCPFVCVVHFCSKYQISL